MNEYEQAVAACPMPIYHETHLYCPSCPWTEVGPLDAWSESKTATAAVVAQRITDWLNAPIEGHGLFARYQDAREFLAALLDVREDPR